MKIKDILKMNKNQVWYKTHILPILFSCMIESHIGWSEIVEDLFISHACSCRTVIESNMSKWVHVICYFVSNQNGRYHDNELIEDL